DDRMLRAILQIDNEADAARIVLAPGVEQAEGLRTIGFASDQVRGGRVSVPCLSHLQCSFAARSSFRPASRFLVPFDTPCVRVVHGTAQTARRNLYSLGAALHPNGRSFGFF